MKTTYEFGCLFPNGKKEVFDNLKGAVKASYEQGYNYVIRCEVADKNVSLSFIGWKLFRILIINQLSEEIKDIPRICDVIGKKPKNTFVLYCCCDINIIDDIDKRNIVSIEQFKKTEIIDENQLAQLLK